VQGGDHCDRVLQRPHIVELDVAGWRQYGFFLLFPIFGA